MDVQLVLSIQKARSESKEINARIDFKVIHVIGEESKCKVVETVFAFCDAEGTKKFNFSDDTEWRRVSSVLTGVYSAFGLNYPEIMNSLIDEYRENNCFKAVEHRHMFQIANH